MSVENEPEQEDPRPVGPDVQAFRCNICGSATASPKTAFGREAASCHSCGSTVRMRSIVHALSHQLFGECLAIEDLPVHPEIKGIGMSDWPGYAWRLMHRLGYRNTFLDEDPMLDVRAPDPDLLGSLDFIISSDVFEHVAPPVQIAFDNARRLLKPDGVMIFSVPYGLDGDTVEHYPDLHDYTIKRRRRGDILVNVTEAGERQEFTDLVYHGGPGETLELRVFSLPSLRRHFAAAGFGEPVIYDQVCTQCGMLHEFHWSQTMAVRPAAAGA